MVNLIFVTPIFDFTLLCLVEYNHFFGLAQGNYLDDFELFREVQDLPKPGSVDRVDDASSSESGLRGTQ